MRVARQLWRLWRDFSVRNQMNAVEAYAAQATLFLVISFFPAAVLLLSLLPRLPFTETQITSLFVRIIPEAIADFVRRVLGELYDGAPVTVTLITAALALWSSSKGSVALIRGLNRIYGIHHTRGYVFTRLLASFYVLIFFVALTILLAFLGFGGVVLDWLSQIFPRPANTLFWRRGLQYFLSFALLFFLFWFLYVAVLQHTADRLQQIPGALLAAGGWVGFSSLFSLYLNHIGGTSTYYGSLSIVVFSLLWLYFCMYIFFIGAQINVWLHDNRSLLHQLRRRKNTRK
jgi:membrane protein